MAYPEGFEPSISRFVAARSIQLSYGYILVGTKRLELLPKGRDPKSRASANSAKSRWYQTLVSIQRDKGYESSLRAAASGMFGGAPRIRT